MSSPDATMTTAGVAESVDGGETVGMPSLRQAARGLAAAVGQGTTVAREAGRLGVELVVQHEPGRDIDGTDRGQHAPPPGQGI